MTEPEETRKVPVNGRDILVRQITDAQAGMMLRDSRRLQREDVANEEKVKATARMFNILESVVIGEADRDYLEDEIVAGKLELKDLLDFIRSFKDEQQKPVVRRGRPPKRPVRS